MTSEAAASPRNEVDEVRWVTPAEARELLSHEYDRALLARVSDGF